MLDRMIAMTRASTTLDQRRSTTTPIDASPSSSTIEPSSSSSSLSKFQGGHNQQQHHQQQQATTATRMLLACSSSVPMRPEHQALITGGDGRRLCEDRRGAFDHLVPAQFVRGAVRVSMQQSATILSHYMSDQLKEDMARDERVQRGELSSQEADDEASEWSDKEWYKRWEVFPTKLITAYMKYHAVTLIMRFYEYLASRYVTLEKLDMFTLDPFSAAKRRAQQQQSSSSGSNSSVTEMTHEAWDANLIAYLADYSLHQIILTAGYYVYIRDHHRRRRSLRLREQNQQQQNQQQQPATDEKDDILEDIATTSPTASDNNNENDQLHTGSVALSFLKKSTLLALSRLVCLSFASVGGGVGNMLYPAWGYMFGFNMGDGCGAAILDEFDLNMTPLQ